MVFRRVIKFIGALILLVFLSGSALNLSYCDGVLPARGSFGEKTIINKSNIDDSYVLFSPFSGNVIYLTDLFGRPVHSWATEFPTSFSLLQKNGHVFAQMKVPPQRLFPAGGTGLIAELDWEGKIIWEYKNMDMHHDFDVLPNGNIAAIAYDELPPEHAKLVRGGVPGTEDNGRTWSDKIIEVDRNKNIVWTWRLFEHINLNDFKLGPLMPRAEIAHSNSIRYLAENPIDGKPAYLLSVRELNSVFMIRREDGGIIWSSPEGGLAYQHDATITSDNTILVFDNNVFSVPDPNPSQGSRVVEFSLSQEEPIWVFRAGDNGLEASKFKADIIGGAQRLQNGNTFIVDGPAGHFFEVTKDKELVWDMVNPYAAKTTSVFPNNIVFKARRYAKDEIDWPERLPQPVPYISQVCSDLREVF